MQLRKIFAAAAAAAMAVSAMSVMAFADTVYGGTDDAPSATLAFTGKQDASDPSTRLDLAIVDGLSAEVGAAYSANEDIVVIVAIDDAASAYFKLAGNVGENWDNGTEGKILEAWADNYNADENTLTVPVSVWGKFDKMYIQGGQGCTFYGVAFSGDAATIEAAKALIADGAADGGAAAGETEAAGTSDKGNAETGAEGVAALAGLAIVAAGAIAVANKRK